MITPSPSLRTKVVARRGTVPLFVGTLAILLATPSPAHSGLVTATFLDRNVDAFSTNGTSIEMSITEGPYQGFGRTKDIRRQGGNISHRRYGCHIRTVHSRRPKHRTKCDQRERDCGFNGTGLRGFRLHRFKLPRNAYIDQLIARRTGRHADDHRHLHVPGYVNCASRNIASFGT